MTQSSFRAWSESGIFKQIFVSQMGDTGEGEGSYRNELQWILAKDSYLPDCAPDAAGRYFSN
jgi:hypothetical protein